MWQLFIISASSPLAPPNKRCLDTWRFPWKTSELANITDHLLSLVGANDVGGTEKHTEIRNKAGPKLRELTRMAGPVLLASYATH